MDRREVLVGCVVVVGLACGGAGRSFSADVAVMDAAGTDAGSGEAAMGDVGRELAVVTDVLSGEAGMREGGAEDARPIDAGGGDGAPVDGADGGECRLFGDYLVAGSTVHFFYRFGAGGAFRGALMRANLDTMPTLVGTYGLTGTRLTFRDNMCGDVEGSYEVTYEPGCDRARLAVVSDRCATGRGEYLNRALLTLQR